MLVLFCGCTAPRRVSGPGAATDKAAVYVPAPVASADASGDESDPEEDETVEAEPGPPLIRVEASDVPERVSALPEFAPSGWKLAQEVRGDLAGAGALDAAIVLVRLSLPEEELASDDEDQFRDRVLVVALAESAGEFRRVGFSNELLGCTQCGGAFWATLEMPIELGIADRRLRIAQEYGSRVVTNVEVHLRYAEDLGRVVLAKRIDHDHDRVTGDFTTLEVDHDAGVRTQSQLASGVTKKKLETFPRTNVFLESLKLSDTP